MQKLILPAALIFAMAAAPVFAAHDGTNPGQAHRDNNASVNAAVVVSSSPTPSASCDPSGDWENHGEFVSCVAHEHIGGAAVAAAAKLSVGKENKDDESSESSSSAPTPSPSETPSSSPSVSPSESPSPTETASPTASSSASPSATLSGSVTIELQALVGVLNQVLDSLKHLINQ